MIKIRDALKEYLKTLHPRVYFQEAPPEADYPYVVFDIPNALPDGECQENQVVDIDGWDRPSKGDTTNIETLMETIEGDGNIHNPTGLNKKTLTAENMVVTFYLGNRLPLIDDDKRIKRRRHTYQARLFGRS